MQDQSLGWLRSTSWYRHPHWNHKRISARFLCPASVSPGLKPACMGPLSCTLWGICMEMNISVERQCLCRRKISRASGKWRNSGDRWELDRDQQANSITSKAGTGCVYSTEVTVRLPIYTTLNCRCSHGGRTGRTRSAGSLPASWLKRANQRCGSGWGWETDHLLFPIKQSDMASFLWEGTGRKGESCLASQYFQKDRCFCFTNLSKDAGIDCQIWHFDMQKGKDKV